MAFVRNLTPNKYVVIDFETTGLNKSDLALTQVGIVVTDGDLNVKRELDMRVQPGLDRRLGLGAGLVTNLTQLDYFKQSEGLANSYSSGVGRWLNADGIYRLPEYAAVDGLQNELNDPGCTTCVIGYNNISFDNKVLEQLLFRNFIDPWAWKWKNGNSTLDVLTLTKAVYSLAPRSLRWHKDTYPNGKTRVSFKLEDVAKANELEHRQAHNALSDAQVTLDLFKKIDMLKKHPELVKLHTHLFRFRKKQDTTSWLQGKQKVVNFNIASGTTGGACYALVVNNVASKFADFRDNKIHLLPLTHYAEDLDYLMGLNDEELRAYLLLGLDKRKVANPIQVVRSNQFAVFAEPHMCSQNPELMAVIDKLEDRANQLLNNPAFVDFTRRYLACGGDQWHEDIEPKEELAPKLVATEDDQLALQKLRQERRFAETGEPIQSEEPTQYDLGLASFLGTKPITTNLQLKAFKEGFDPFAKAELADKAMLFPDTVFYDYLDNFINDKQMAGVWSITALSPVSASIHWLDIKRVPAFSNLAILNLGNRGHLESLAEETQQFYINLMKARFGIYHYLKAADVAELQLRAHQDFDFAARITPEFLSKSWEEMAEWEKLAITELEELEVCAKKNPTAKRVTPYVTEYGNALMQWGLGLYDSLVKELRNEEV